MSGGRDRSDERATTPPIDDARRPLGVAPLLEAAAPAKRVVLPPPGVGVGTPAAARYLSEVLIWGRARVGSGVGKGGALAARPLLIRASPALETIPSGQLPAAPAAAGRSTRGADVPRVPPAVVAVRDAHVAGDGRGGDILAVGSGEVAEGRGCGRWVGAEEVERQAEFGLRPVPVHAGATGPLPALMKGEGAGGSSEAPSSPAPPMDEMNLFTRNVPAMAAAVASSRGAASPNDSSVIVVLERRALASSAGPEASSPLMSMTN